MVSSSLIAFGCVHLRTTLTEAPLRLHLLPLVELELDRELETTISICREQIEKQEDQILGGDGISEENESNVRDLLVEARPDLLPRRAQEINEQRAA